MMLGPSCLALPGQGIMLLVGRLGDQAVAETYADG